MPTTTEITTTLNQKASRLTLITVALLVLGVVMAVIFIFLTGNYVKKHATLVQQRLTTQQSLSGTQNLTGYVQTNLDALNELQDIFPNEATIIDAIQTLETLVQNFDPKGTAKFTSLTPMPKNNQLSIPLALKLKTSPYKSIDLLRQLERLPYVFEVTNYDLHLPSGASDSADLDIKVVLYVQDPFRQTN